jgi:hypothetical protein
LAQIFPKWTNKLGIYIIIALILIVIGVTAFFTYYGSPQYREMGFQPTQPVAYSHKLHAGDLGMDCRYCHYDIEYSATANVPATQICMNCHRMIGFDKPSLDPVRSSWNDNKPILWIRIYQTPDFVYFNHAPHLRAGVGCYSCHGDVRAMIKVMQARPLNMKWCLDCHRNPQMSLRPQSELTNMHWNPPPNQQELAAKMIAEKKIAPPVDCSGCHR